MGWLAIVLRRPSMLKVGNRFMIKGMYRKGMAISDIACRDGCGAYRRAK
jgi:hypothetical protein